MTIIKDGAGTGNTLRITRENRANVSSVSRSVTQHINEVYETHWSLFFEAVDPTGADDYFFYLKNTGTKNIHITKSRFNSTVAGTVEFHRVTGTASSVNDIVPANRNLGSTTAPTATIGTNVDITGLTNANTLLHLRLDTANKDVVDEHPSHIIVPPGQAFALLWDTGTGILKGTIDIYEDLGTD
jgi:archaellum component FlaG (FlaF/FlaG flagellin family)